MKCRVKYRHFCQNLSSLKYFCVKKVPHILPSGVFLMFFFLRRKFFANTLRITLIKILSNCEIDYFKVVFCRVRTNNTRGIYPGYYPTKNFCEFCSTFISVPGTSGSSVRHSYPYPELLEVLYDIHTRTRGMGISFYNYVSSVRPCHNTRNICEFCNTSVPYPEVSVSSVRSPYPNPELL